MPSLQAELKSVEKFCASPKGRVTRFLSFTPLERLPRELNMPYGVKHDIKPTPVTPYRVMLFDGGCDSKSPTEFSETAR